jgi:hypothetical protein
VSRLDVARRNAFSKAAVVKEFVDDYGSFGSPGQFLDEITHLLANQPQITQIFKTICVICGWLYFFFFPKYGGSASEGETAAAKASKSTPEALPSVPRSLAFACGVKRQSPST